MSSQVKSKVILLGDFAVGKTSLVQRFVYDVFGDAYLTTIGVKVTKKDMTVAAGDGDAGISLLLWDIAGNDGFSRVSPEYLRGASAGIIVGDITRPDTLNSMQHHAGALLEVCPGAEVIFAFNKSDLADRSTLQMNELNRQYQNLNNPENIRCFNTSAKDGTNVRELFAHLATVVFRRTNR